MTTKSTPLVDVRCVVDAVDAVGARRCRRRRLCGACIVLVNDVSDNVIDAIYPSTFMTSAIQHLVKTFIRERVRVDFETVGSCAWDGYGRGFYAIAGKPRLNISKSFVVLGVYETNDEDAVFPIRHFDSFSCAVLARVASGSQECSVT